MDFQAGCGGGSSGGLDYGFVIAHGGIPNFVTVGETPVPPRCFARGGRQCGEAIPDKIRKTGQPLGCPHGPP